MSRNDLGGEKFSERVARNNVNKGKHRTFRAKVNRGCEEERKQ